MSSRSLGFGSTTNFFEAEYKSLDLKDKRLNKRALSTFQALQATLTTCIRRLRLGAKDLRQTYDFFSNPKVSGSALIEPHYQNTVHRFHETEAKYILAVQDNTFLNYSSHHAKEGMGKISHIGNRDQTGLILHSTLIITDQNEPLGLIDLAIFHYDEFEFSKHRRDRCIEEKQNICWINSVKNMRERLGISNKKIITVADREGDFFEFLHELSINNELFVVRASHNRHTGKKHREHRNGTDKLFNLINQTDDFNEVMKININDVKTHQIKEVALRIKKISMVELPASPEIKSKSEKTFNSIFVNAVKAYNEDYCWIVLTNLPVDTFEDCKTVLEIYKARWHIEDYHKVLKTGYQIDEIYLHASREAVENALTMAAISACRLYWIIYVGRVEKTASAQRLFTEYEWKSVYVYFREKIPTNTPSLSEVIIKIAQLGGYMPRKNAAPPGIKSMWLGLQAFATTAEMYKGFMETKT